MVPGGGGGGKDTILMIPWIYHLYDALSVEGSVYVTLDNPSSVRVCPPMSNYCQIDFQWQLNVLRLRFGLWCLLLHVYSATN